jgi:hypothetical protein
MHGNNLLLEVITHVPLMDAEHNGVQAIDALDERLELGS